MSLSPRAVAGLVAAGCVLLAVQGYLLGECLQDDAFISLRYSRNLAEGNGLVFNPGERVEGYTNFSWTVLHAVPFLVGIGATSFMRVAGFASGMAAVLGAASLAGRLAPGRPAALAVAAILTGALPFLAAEAVMGLETAAFAGIVAFALSRYIAERRDPGKHPALSGGLFALAALTRPEGALVAGLCGLADLPGMLRRQAGELRRGVVRWVTFLVPVAAHLGFRVAYYGDVVPNTFRAKVGGGLATWIRGLDYAGDFALVTLPLLVVGAIGAISVIRNRADRIGAIVPLLAAVYALYVIGVGGDYKPSFRFFVVPAVLAAVLAAVAVASVLRGTIVPWIVVLLIAGWTLAAGGDARAFAKWRAEQLTVHRAAGRWLAGATDPSDWLATGNAGVLPFYSRLPTIDMYGLADRHIALRDLPGMGSGAAGHEKGDGAYVLDRAPRIILFQFARFTPAAIDRAELGGLRMSVSEREIWNDPRFAATYHLRTERLPGFYFNYFERKEGP